MMKTRSIQPQENEEITEAKSFIADINSPQLVILPKGLSSAARICTLPHSRDSRPSRFLFCPNAGLYELKQISPSRHAKQSWLISPAGWIHDQSLKHEAMGNAHNQIVEGNAELAAQPEQVTTSKGHVLKSPSLLVATPFDPIFLVLPPLLQHTMPRDETSKGRFLSFDDIFESTCDESAGLRWLLRQDQAQKALIERVRAVCNTVPAGDEEMYCLSIAKLLDSLVAKAKAMVRLGLPKSMEDQFVSRALERPVLGLKREESSMSKLVATVGEELSVEASQSSETTTNSTPVETQASVQSAETAVTTPDQSPSATSAREITDLLKLRTCLHYTMAAYVNPNLTSILKARLTSDESPINFKSLDEELSQIAAMRVETGASRAYSRKRGVEDDEEAAEANAEKKRKKEEDEKRKRAGESHGLRALKKVDTSGMKKMSDFFGKGAATKKVK